MLRRAKFVCATLRFEFSFLSFVCMKLVTHNHTRRKFDHLCTCSGSGSEQLAAMTFETVVIDEATQAVEPSTLVALMHGAGLCYSIDVCWVFTFSDYDFFKFLLQSSMYIGWRSSTIASSVFINIKILCLPLVTHVFF